MGSLVLAGATSGSTTITPTDAVTATVTLPSTGGTIQTSGSGFTTNGVAYASSTSALTTGSGLVFSGGKLGIGTTTPNYTLEVYGSSNPAIALTSTSASLYSYYSMTTGSVGAQLYTFGQSYSAVYPAGCTALANDTWGLLFNASNASGIITYQTNGTERMRIDSAGRLGIGTTSLATSSNQGLITAFKTGGATFNFGPNGTSSFVVFSGNTGVYIDAGSTSWSSTSDARLKNVTGTYATALADIAQIQAVKFTWKDDETNKPQVGVIAQSVENVVPEAITQSQRSDEDETKYLGVRYTELIPLLIASVQELNTLITAQSATITSLTERITALEGK